MRFVSGRLTHAGPEQIAEARGAVNKGQSPFAVIVGCSDSRVGPEIVFDQGLGDLFVVRTAGEVIDSVALGSIEYAVEHPSSTLIVVPGHERCGAVSAAVAGAKEPGHIAAVINAIEPAVKQTRGLFNPELYTQFVGGNKASLDGVNEYRLAAYATLLFRASSDSSFLPSWQTASIPIAVVSVSCWFSAGVVLIM